MFSLRPRSTFALAVWLVAVTSCGGLMPSGCGFSVGSRQAQDPSGGGIPAPAPADPAAPPARPKVVILGDSLTAGYGLLESAAFPSVLQQKLDEDGYNFEIVNAGVSGDTTAGGLRRLDWALEGDVKVLIVALGGNDGLRGLSIAEMKQNVTTIITKARERNVVVILAGMEAPPNYGPEYVQSFRAAFQDVARQQRVLFIPFLLDKVAGIPSLNQADGIHPNPQGARIVADTVWTVLRSVLDQMVASS